MYENQHTCLSEKLGYWTQRRIALSKKWNKNSSSTGRSVAYKITSKINRSGMYTLFSIWACWDMEFIKFFYTFLSLNNSISKNNLLVQGCFLHMIRPFCPSLVSYVDALPPASCAMTVLHVVNNTSVLVTKQHALAKSQQSKTKHSPLRGSDGHYRQDTWSCITFKNCLHLRFDIFVRSDVQLNYQCQNGHTNHKQDGYRA